MCQKGHQHWYTAAIKTNENTREGLRSWAEEGEEKRKRERGRGREKEIERGEKGVKFAAGVNPA